MTSIFNNFSFALLNITSDFSSQENSTSGKLFISFCNLCHCPHHNSIHLSHFLNISNFIK
ncbi:TPA: hypothetical protein DEG21_00875 [Patescibacteria group bacterium]|nr:hypothetical protein [Candidatus Gracilibacteria bacterium]